MQSRVSEPISAALTVEVSFFAMNLTPFGFVYESDLRHCFTRLRKGPDVVPHPMVRESRE